MGVSAAVERKSMIFASCGYQFLLASNAGGKNTIRCSCLLREERGRKLRRQQPCEHDGINGSDDGVWSRLWCPANDLWLFSPFFYFYFYFILAEKHTNNKKRNRIAAGSTTGSAIIIKMLVALPSLCLNMNMSMNMGASRSRVLPSYHPTVWSRLC